MFCFDFHTNSAHFKNSHIFRTVVKEKDSTGNISTYGNTEKRKKLHLGGEVRINEVGANRRENPEMIGAHRRSWRPEKVAELLPGEGCDYLLPPEYLTHHYGRLSQSQQKFNRPLRELRVPKGAQSFSLGG